MLSDLELVVIIPALKMWCHYLLRIFFMLVTDHIILKHVPSQPDLNVRQNKWMDFLSEFNFDIKHIKSK